MTTIVYRDGLMAVDTRAYIGNCASLGKKVKLHRLDDGTLIAASTRDVGVPDAVVAWFSEGMKDGPSGLKERLALTQEVGFEMLAVASDGVATYVDGNALPTKAKADFYAVGSGSQYALGAMEAGATAEEACRIACKLDPWTEEPIEVMGHSG